MANENPTRGRRAVPVDLPVAHVAILRSGLSDWIAGARDDLTGSATLKDPDGTRQECAAFERLLSGLNEGQIFVPDEAARAAIEAASAAADEESGYAEALAAHEAHHALLELLGGMHD